MEDTPLVAKKDDAPGKLDWLEEPDMNAPPKKSGAKQGKEDYNENNRMMPPRRNLCHMIFVFISLVAVVSSSCMALSQVLTIAVCEVTRLQLLLRVYIFVFCLIFILTELEVEVMKNVPTFKNWILRGFVYSFIGVVGVEESYSVSISGTELERPIHVTVSGQISSLFILTSSLAIVFVGFVYFIMGILCLRKLRDKLRKEYDAKFSNAESPGALEA